MKTRDSVLREIGLVHSVVEQWRLSDTPNVLWQGQTRKAISTELQQAFDRLIAFAKQDEFVESARDLVLGIDDFESALEAWLEKAARDPASSSPSGSAEMWSAWEHLVQLQEPSTPFKPPEPIEQLIHRDKVPLSQIAKIYGFVTPQGQPDLAKLQEEIAKPGTHFDPTTWVHPSRQKMLQQIDSRWQQRQKSSSPRGKTQALTSQVAIESTETLLRQGVDFRQIARMKRISIADVEQEATRLGIRAQRQRVPYPASPTVAHLERMQEQSLAAAEYQSHSTTITSDTEPAEVARLVREYGNMGLSPEQIRQSLANIKPDLTDQEIQAALYPEPPPRSVSRKGK